MSGFPNIMFGEIKNCDMCKRDSIAHYIRGDDAPRCFNCHMRLFILSRNPRIQFEDGDDCNSHPTIRTSQPSQPLVCGESADC